MKKYQIGDVVRHDFSMNHGTVTEIREHEKYTTYVRWDNTPEKNDWYNPEVLEPVRASFPQSGNPVLTLGAVDGAIGISKSTQTDSETHNLDTGLIPNFPFKDA